MSQRSLVPRVAFFSVPTYQMDLVRAENLHAFSLFLPHSNSLHWIEDLENTAQESFIARSGGRFLVGEDTCSKTAPSVGSDKQKSWAAEIFLLIFEGLSINRRHEREKQNYHFLSPLSHSSVSLFILKLWKWQCRIYPRQDALSLFFWSRRAESSFVKSRERSEQDCVKDWRFSCAIHYWQS